MKKGALSFNSLIKIVLVSMFIFIGFLVLRDGVQPTMDRILDVFSLEARSSSSGSGAHQEIRDGQERAANVFGSLANDLDSIKNNQDYRCFALLEPIPKDLFDDYNISFKKSGNDLDFSLIPKQGIGEFRYNIDNINLCVVTNAKDQQRQRNVDVRNIFINDNNVKCADSEVIIERSGRLKIDGVVYRVDSMEEIGIFTAFINNNLFIVPTRSATNLLNRGCTFRGDHFTTPCFDFTSNHFLNNITDYVCDGFDNRFGG